VKLLNTYAERVRRSTLLEWLSLPSSTYYYEPKAGKPGRRPSTHTFYKDQWVSNHEVISAIKTIILGPYNAYGYQNVTAELRDRGYWIDDKKVYRIMDEEHLLLGKVIKTKGKRTWVQFRTVQASRPMEHLCLDIKYVWVHGEGRWYYQLSIMDIFSRKIIHWILQKSVRKQDVINMFRELHLIYDLKGVIIRNDNGSQFIANELRRTLMEMEARQEFTHVATPEENAYIESFHSIQQRELFSRYEFLSYYEAKQHIQDYMRWYNYERKHGKLGRITPQQKWSQTAVPVNPYLCLNNLEKTPSLQIN
jgi:transposase InsO family protein